MFLNIVFIIMNMALNSKDKVIFYIFDIQSET